MKLKIINSRTFQNTPQRIWVIKTLILFTRRSENSQKIQFKTNAKHKISTWNFFRKFKLCALIHCPSSASGKLNYSITHIHAFSSRESTRFCYSANGTAPLKVLPHANALTVFLLLELEQPGGLQLRKRSKTQLKQWCVNILIGVFINMFPPPTFTLFWWFFCNRFIYSWNFGAFSNFYCFR